MDPSRKIILDMDTVIVKPGDCILIRPGENIDRGAVRHLIQMFETAKSKGHYPGVDLLILNSQFEVSVIRPDRVKQISDENKEATQH